MTMHSIPEIRGGPAEEGVGCLDMLAFCLCGIRHLLHTFTMAFVSRPSTFVSRGVRRGAKFPFAFLVSCMFLAG
jgi:hypothetical protein